ncbi:methyl-accepting chemotaxis protein [Paenibacillus sp. HWE-109]|uniref:methyl-accepting chemotaxis protein n=1 Tax=Paenibacillus sp. HWE-109 TaxID=1306526 RepID=UPI001EDF9FCD|nr:methyl-accepting chemotaxis protein [Paenibacillus sp. HWE-109]UKS29180.1 methyl-accepting chemotaxis protein [Paenibacillus sp. HWE-109]
MFERVVHTSKSLKFKLTSLLLAVSLIPLIISMFILTTQSTKSVQTITDDGQLQLARAHGDAIQAFVNQKIRLVENTIKAHPEFQNNETSKVMPILMQLKESNEDVAFFAYADSKGFITQTDGSSFDGASFANIIQLKTTKNMAVSDIIMDARTNKMIIIIDIPILNAKGDYDGAIQTILDPSRVVDIISNVHFGASGYGYLVGQDGTVLVHPMKELIGKKLDDLLVSSKEIKESMVSQVEGKTAYTLKSGEKMQATYEKIGTLGWRLIVTAPETEVFKDRSIAMRNSIIIVVICCLIVSVLAYLIGSVAVRPILAISNLMLLAAKGDFTVKPLVVTNKDEISQLSTAVNEMIANLRTLIGGVIQTSGSVAVAADQISASTEEIAQGSTHQATASQTMAELFKELSAAINTVAISAEDAAELAAQTVHIAKKGSSTIHNSINGMDQVNQQMKLLETDSQRIGEIIEVIDDISEQTNLLALNAAIEAARAGEQGRGFAVVAEEVRKLAERSSLATKQIAQIIRDMQVNTNKSVRVVADGVAQSKLTYDAFESIVNKVNETSSKVTEIAAASEEQAAQASEVMTAIESVAATSEECAAGAQETAATSQELAKLAENLHDAAAVFKIK